MNCFAMAGAAGPRPGSLGNGMAMVDAARLHGRVRPGVMSEDIRSRGSQSDASVSFSIGNKSFVLNKKITT